MAKFFFMLLFSVSSLSSIAQQGNNGTISWPADYEPSKSKFFVHNEIEIQAAPEQVWDILIDALQWPSWYKGAKNVRLADQNDNVLNADAVL